MSLNAHDKAAVKALWGKIASSKDVIGVEAIYRMLQVYPQTKIYFSHWKDLSKNSAELKTQARTVTDAIGEAVANIDDIPAAFIQHSELHAFQLRVDPTNFKILSHNLLVAIAILFPKEFTPEAHVAVDKFLANVASALSERYR